MVGVLTEAPFILILVRRCNVAKRTFHGKSVASGAAPCKRKGLKGLSLLLVVIILSFAGGGAGSVVTDRYILPYLSTIPYFEKYDFLKPHKPVIIEINEKKRHVCSGCWLVRASAY